MSELTLDGDDSRIQQLRTAWEHATERIDQHTESNAQATSTEQGAALWDVLADFVELADAVQRYLGIDVDHDKLR